MSLPRREKHHMFRSVFDESARPRDASLRFIRFSVKVTGSDEGESGETHIINGPECQAAHYLDGSQSELSTAFISWKGIQYAGMILTW